MTAPTSRYRFGFFATPDALPEGSSRLWEGGVAESFFLSRAWFDCLVAEGLDPGDKLALGALQAEDGRVLALLPARFTNRGAGLLPARRLRSLTGPYACLFHPILTPDVDQTPIAPAPGH